MGVGPGVDRPGVAVPALRVVVGLPGLAENDGILLRDRADLPRQAGSVVLRTAGVVAVDMGCGYELTGGIGRVVAQPARQAVGVVDTPEHDDVLRTGAADGGEQLLHSRCLVADARTRSAVLPAAPGRAC